MSHLTIAASAKAFNELFTAVRDHFTFVKSDSKDFGPFSASYSVNLHLKGGTIQLNDDNTLEIQNVDIVFDTLTLTVCFDLPGPGITIPSFCAVPDPWNGCLVGFEGFTIGGRICAPLDLSGLVSKIIDIRANLAVRYYVDPARLPGWSDLDAELNGHSNKWQIFIHPVWVNVEPIDIPATAENFLIDAVKKEIEKMFPSWLPGWAKHTVWAIIGPVLDIITSGLNIVGSVTHFISDLLGSMFGLLGLIETAVTDQFANKYPIYEFEDPYPVLAGSGGLIPVKIPIRNPGAVVNSHEMIVTGDVG